MSAHTTPSMNGDSLHVVAGRALRIAGDCEEDKGVVIDLLSLFTLPLCIHQVSHHPPVSTLYVTNRKDGFTLSATILAKSKYYGSIITHITFAPLKRSIDAGFCALQQEIHYRPCWTVLPG